MLTWASAFLETPATAVLALTCFLSAVMAIGIIFPCTNRAFGGDDALAATAFPGILLGIELAGVVVFLNTTLADSEFYFMCTRARGLGGACGPAG